MATDGGADGDVVVVNPKPQNGLTSKVIDFVESLIVKFMYDTSQPHHYLSGNFAPVSEETPPTKSLTVIGHLPDCLNGEFVRVGPNPKFSPVAGYHWFDGDGMIHGLHIKDGKATYVSRFVRTSRLKQEEFFGGAKFMKVGDLKGLFGLLMVNMQMLRAKLKVLDVSYGTGTGNTALIYHHGKLLALQEADKPYAIKVLEDGDLQTLGMLDYDKRLQHSFTAHPKVDPYTGEMFTFGYSHTPPYITYRVISKDGFMHDPVPITISDPIMMHDFAITENYAIFMDLPLYFRPKEMVKENKLIFTFDATKKARFGVLPRYAKNEAQIRWFELPNCFIFHNANAWEEEEEVVLITCRLENPDLDMVNGTVKEKLENFANELYEMRFNLKTGLASQKKLSAPAVDFPRVNESYTGRKQRYVYGTILDSIAKVTGVIKFDLHAEPEAGKTKLEVGGNVKGIFDGHGSVKPNEASIPEGQESDIGLDKNFGFSKQFLAHYELGEEVGRGHFGYTCSAKAKKGSLKGQDVAVKVIPKSKMTTAIAVEDVRREVKILQALTGHKNLVHFYDAYEDDDNVYIIMELCKGGELLDRILSRGGKYSEEDAKVVMVQILSVVAFCHFQGVVHRDLKPENFLFTSKDEKSPLKAIDFGLSDYVKPDERLNDIVGSAYYVAPEVLHRSYGTEADMWSIGVIAYILLCGSRPFWARTESGIFRAVLKADPSFDEAPWPSLSPEAIDFVKGLLNKDYRKRLTAAQALSHPWLANYHDVKIPSDMIVYKLVKTYIASSSLRKEALRALAKTLTVAQLAYLREQFTLLGPNKSGFISMQNYKMAVTKNSTDAMKDARVLDYASMIGSLQYRKLDFEEFCAAAISVHQLEGMETWEQHARQAYDLFEKDGNRPIMIEELASELGLGPSVPVHVVLQDWIRHSDGKLSFLGFVRLLHGVSSRTFQKA